MSVLTSGRTNPCKDNVGGLREIWLTEYIPYSQNLIVGYRDMLVSSFPTTLMFKYEGQNKSFSENIREDKGYDQEINFRMTHQNITTNQLVTILSKTLLRAVLVYNSGKIKVAGIHNGLDAEIGTSQGGSKVDFNGYDIKLTGIEPFKAPFIANFPGSGFVKDGVEFNCLFSSSGKPSSLADKVSSCNVLQ